MDHEEIKVTGGIGAFFWGATPAALGIGALIWLAFFTGIIQFHQKSVQEGRRDDRVGAGAQLNTPVELLFNGKGCIHVERAFLDEDTLTAYLHNVCQREIRDIRWAERELAPDGTTVEARGDYIDGNDDMISDEKREVQVSITNDKRVTKILFAVDDFNDFEH